MVSALVAVNTGPVVLPAGDAPPHILYNALGDTVNVAARWVMGTWSNAMAMSTFADAVVQRPPVGNPLA
jgi:hypothetical protein